MTALTWPFGLAAAPFDIGAPNIPSSPRLELRSEYRGASGRGSLSLPKFGITVPLSRTFSLNAGATYRVLFRRGTRRRMGFGDTEVKAKWRFMEPEENEYGLAFAIEPKVTEPVGDEARGLGAGYVTLTLPVIVGKQIGNWEFVGQVGYARNVGQSESTFPFGLAVGRRVTPRLTLGAQIQGEGPDVNYGGVDLNGNINARWTVSESLDLLAMIGRTIDSPAPSLNRFRLGLDVRF